MSSPKLTLLRCSHCKARWPWGRPPCLSGLQIAFTGLLPLGPIQLTRTRPTRNQSCDPAPGRAPGSAPRFGAGRSPDRACSKKRLSEACRLREGRGPAGLSELGAQQVSRPVACCSCGRQGLLRFCFFLFLTELLKKDSEVCQTFAVFIWAKTNLNWVTSGLEHAKEEPQRTVQNERLFKAEGSRKEGKNKTKKPT